MTSNVVLMEDTGKIHLRIQNTKTGSSHQIKMTVLAHGCFDPFHIGHLWHLEEACRMGNKLIVAVTRNEYVNKGPMRPVFDEKDRAHVVEALRCVDGVLLVRNSLEALKLVKPDIFVKGSEYIGKLEKLAEAFCLKNGIEIAFTRTKTYSSSKLLRHYD